MNAPVVPTDADLHALASRLGTALQSRGAMLAAAESCTGGWIGKCMTEIPGSSAWFHGSAVTYSNAAKHALLGVSADTLARHGAVSRDTALAMTAGTLARFGADVAVAVTGIAGPDGGSAEKPVGTVWIAWQWRGGAAQAERFRFAGDRAAVRRQTVASALEGVRKVLTV